MSEGRVLQRSITLPQAVALYIGAVVGAGVLILPGVAADAAGSGSIVAWVFDSLLGLPLALTFAALAARYPDAGGVSTYVGRAFGSAWGGVVGWFYFFAAATGQVIVPLTGAYYAASALGLSYALTFVLAAGILALAVGANLRGLRLSGRVQLALSGGVALILLSAAATALPRVSLDRLLPLIPDDPTVVGRAAVLLFFAFFGWEAIAQLSAEFHRPGRDVPRATYWSVGLITLLYLSVAVAVVGTGTYGSADVNRVAVARVLADSLGVRTELVVAAAALVISLGTTNAFVAATSRLGYALGRDAAFPAWMGVLDARSVPARAVWAVGLYAAAGMVVAYGVGWGAEDLLVVPNSLGISTYVVGMAAGARLLAGRGRTLAVVGFVLCLAVLPFSGASILFPVTVGVAALGYRRLRWAGSRRPSITHGPSDG